MYGDRRGAVRVSRVHRPALKLWRGDMICDEVMSLAQALTSLSSLPASRFSYHFDSPGAVVILLRLCTPTAEECRKLLPQQITLRFCQGRSLMSAKLQAAYQPGVSHSQSKQLNLYTNRPLRARMPTMRWHGMVGLWPPIFQSENLMLDPV